MEQPEQPGWNQQVGEEEEDGQVREMEEMSAANSASIHQQTQASALTWPRLLLKERCPVERLSILSSLSSFPSRLFSSCVHREVTNRRLVD